MTNTEYTNALKVIESLSSKQFEHAAAIIGAQPEHVLADVKQGLRHYTLKERLTEEFGSLPAIHDLHERLLRGDFKPPRR